METTQDRPAGDDPRREKTGSRGTVRQPPEALPRAPWRERRVKKSGWLLAAVALFFAALGYRFIRGSFPAVEPGHVVTLRIKENVVEKAKLEAEARKAVQVKQAEAAASQRLIGARAEADVMQYVLALKEKEIRQKKLEAEVERQSRVERAKADAEIMNIMAKAEVQRRKAMADAEAYTIRSTSLAQFEGLQREAELVSANPLLIPKTFADRLSEKVQVILTPSIGGEAFTGEVVRRVMTGESAPEACPATVRVARKLAAAK